MAVEPHELYISSLAEGSRRASSWAAAKVIEALGGPVDWGAVSYADAQRMRATLVGRFAPATVRRCLVAWRRTVRAAWRMGLLDRERAERLQDLEPVRGSAELAGRQVEPWELRRLFRSLGDSPVGRRDGAALALLAACGLRRAEAAALEVEALSLGREWVRVLGKGRKERSVPVPVWARDFLRRWDRIRGPGAGRYLWRAPWGRPMIDSSVGGSALYEMVRRRAAAAGIRHATPHDLRRTYAGTLLDAGVDLALVARLLGHSDPKTTARYDRRPIEGAARVVDATSPFRGA